MYLFWPTETHLKYWQYLLYVLCYDLFNTKVFSSVISNYHAPFNFNCYILLTKHLSNITQNNSLNFSWPNLFCVPPHLRQTQYKNKKPFILHWQILFTFGVHKYWIFFLLNRQELFFLTKSQKYIRIKILKKK